MRWRLRLGTSSKIIDGKFILMGVTKESLKMSLSLSTRISDSFGKVS